MKTIEVDDTVYEALAKRVSGFGETPNLVLRRLLELADTAPIAESAKVADPTPTPLPVTPPNPPKAVTAAQTVSARADVTSGNPEIRIVRYKRATGYAVLQKDALRSRFVVQKGSLVPVAHSDTFARKEGLLAKKNSLLQAGILQPYQASGGAYYIFTQDYEFDSPSAAACLVDGNSRSGSMWQ